MNVAWPPFSAVSASQVTFSISRSIAEPSAVKKRAPSCVIATISSFSICWTWRVSLRKAGMAEAKNCSPSPRPTISGHSLRAATSTSGSAPAMATNA